MLGDKYSLINVCIVYYVVLCVYVFIEMHVTPRNPALSS